MRVKKLDMILKTMPKILRKSTFLNQPSTCLLAAVFLGAGYENYGLEDCDDGQKAK